MTNNELDRYIDDLLAGRQPRPFTPDEFEAAQIRVAIELAAAREDSADLRPEFLDNLKSRLATEMAAPADSKPEPVRRKSVATRRQVIVGTAAAATAAVAAVSVDRLLNAPDDDQQSAAGGSPELVPTQGSWQQVARSSELSEGTARPFDLGSVNGFVRRVQGRVEAVSGVCTHQGCKLWLDQSADRLRCPCHSTSFSLTGDVVAHALPTTPNPLPHFDVRENGGHIEVLAPTIQNT